MSSASAAWPAIDERGLERLAVDRPVRVERDERQRPEDLGLRGERDDRRGRALLEERDERLVRRAERRGAAPASRTSGLPAAERRSAVRGESGCGSERIASQRLGQPLLAHVHRHGDEQRRRARRACAATAASTSSVSTIVRVTASSVGSSERLSENDARDLVERAQPPRRLTLGVERLLALVVRPASSPRAGVRSGRRPRAARRARAAAAPRSRSARGPRRGRRRAGRSARRARAAGPRSPPRCRAPRARRARRAGAGRSPRTGYRAARDRGRARAASSSRRSATRACGPVSPRCGRGLEPLRARRRGRRRAARRRAGSADVLDRRLERVGERQLRDRLADDRQQRARALELDRRASRRRSLARSAWAARTAKMPSRSSSGSLGCGSSASSELQGALRRLAELERHDGAAVLERLDRERVRHVARPADGLERHRGRKRSARERGQHRPLLLVAPDDAGARAGRLGRECRHLVGRARLVGAGRQRVARRARAGRAQRRPSRRRRRRLAGRARSLRQPRARERRAHARRTRPGGEAARASRRPRCPSRTGSCSTPLAPSCSADATQRRRQPVALVERLSPGPRAARPANPRARPAAPRTRRAPHGRPAAPESSTSRTTTTSAPVTSAVRADDRSPAPRPGLRAHAISPGNRHRPTASKHGPTRLRAWPCRSDSTSTRSCSTRRRSRGTTGASGSSAAPARSGPARRTSRPCASGSYSSRCSRQRRPGGRDLEPDPSSCSAS